MKNFKIKLLHGYLTYELKITQTDYALLAGFIFCCITISYMAWVIAE